MPTEPSDQYLLYQVSVLRKREAFELLYLRYVQHIRKFIYFRISRPEDVDDLTADVFGGTWEYLTKDKPAIQNFRAFIYKIARNVIANFYRAQGKTPRMIDIDDPEENVEIAAKQENILDKKFRVEDEDALIEYVQKLREPLREVIALRFFEELSINEIAEIIDKKPGNVRVIIHRGITELQRMLKQI